MSRFTGKVALITGGASGIGRATAERMASEGATVVIADIQDELGRQTAAEINAADGGTAVYQHLDVTDEDSWTAAVAAVVDQHGRLDVLVNNAGIGDTSPVQDTDLSTWNKVIAVTQTSVFLGLKACYAALKEAKGNSVTTSSMYGIVGSAVAGPGYQAAKGAVRLLSKNAAMHWVGDGIRVNSVHPGFIDTPILGETDRSMLSEITPMKRLGRAEEVAGLICYLASDEAAFITGAEFVIDGGFTAQ